MRKCIFDRTCGFTLVELLVVIFIIVLICSLSVPLIELFTVRSSVEYGGRITINACIQARQWATAKRIPHLIRFVNVQERNARFGQIMISHHISTHDSGYRCFETSHYTPSREAVRLPNNVVFDLFPTPGICVNRDGTFYMQSNVSSETFNRVVDPRTNWGDIATSSNCDIIIGRASCPRKFGIDIIPSTGRARGAMFRRGDEMGTR